MKEYGIKNSWHKEVVITEAITKWLDWPYLDYIYVIDGLKDGTILLTSSEAEVYTLGTCQWRRVKGVPYWVYRSYLCYNPYGSHGTYLNDHCHWIVDDQHALEKLCRFDLDKETFQLFPSPPPEAIQGNEYHDQSLGVLKGCLCQLDAYVSQFTIWVMREYGVKNSWHKEVVIKQGSSFDLRWPQIWPAMYLIGELKDGSILTVCNYKLWAFHPRSKKIEATKIHDPNVTGLAYRPSFLKLRNFESERVHIF
ncbi:hypothetical protein OSB04_016200 [Centaurea solstitialis]|uniref:F-box associated beta-propeller type 1 domain-containing protein n=1 Tax=Centaurea solstitialis TaxID=347529 RepID=A0AA38WH77_9ASTR|nr:hypothetical protein OSB04_016200 [Centaurea solstitialis]